MCPKLKGLHYWPLASVASLKRTMFRGRSFMMPAGGGSGPLCPWKKLCRFLFASAIISILSIPVLIAFSSHRLLPSDHLTKDFSPARIQAKIMEENLPTAYKKRLPSVPKIVKEDSSTIPKSRSFCPVNEILKSPSVTKLGSYPQTKRFLSVGISSVARPNGTNYLLQTVQSLIDNMSDTDKKDTYIVIFLADLHEPLKSTAKAGISRTFGKYIDQGLLVVIEAYPEYYPPLTNIKNLGKKNNGDSESRRTWRSKENVDVAYVMCYCRDISHYYIHLEDDVISSPSFFPKLQDFLKAQTDKPWAMLDLAIRGSIAKGFFSQDLENIASYLYRKYDEIPVDLLMIAWRKINDQKQRRVPPASLFQHIGDQSSLEEKGLSGLGRTQVEPFFDQYEQKYKGLNPLASVTSSLSSHQGKPQDAYEKGSGYFWAKNPQKGDDILIKFNIPTAVRTVFVDTGCNSLGHDILKSGVLQVSFESAKNNIQTKSNDSCGTFETFGTFVRRKVKISLDESKKVVCLRILVTSHQSEFIYLREIDVW